SAHAWSGYLTRMRGGFAPGKIAWKRSGSPEGQPVLCSLDIRPGNLRIVGEDREPLLRDGPGVVAFAVFQYLKRKKIVGHCPHGIEVPGGGNEVRNVTSRLAATAEEDRPHVSRVAGPNFHGDSRRDLRVAVNELHLAGL